MEYIGPQEAIIQTFTNRVRHICSANDLLYEWDRIEIKIPYNEFLIHSSTSNHGWVTKQYSLGLSIASMTHKYAMENLKFGYMGVVLVHRYLKISD